MGTVSQVRGVADGVDGIVALCSLPDLVWVMLATAAIEIKRTWAVKIVWVPVSIPRGRFTPSRDACFICPLGPPAVVLRHATASVCH